MVPRPTMLQVYYPNLTMIRSGICRYNSVCLSFQSVTFVAILSRLKFSPTFLRHFVA